MKRIKAMLFKYAERTTKKYGLEDKRTILIWTICEKIGG